MTPDEIIETAREAGFDIDGLSEGQAVEFYEEWLNKMGAFAKLVKERAASKEREAFAAHAVDIARRAVAQEREACAIVCDEQAQNWKNPKYHYAEASANHCAKAIRARGES